ncbi:hypothetical protein MICRO11B_40012 [Micrococcus luteus]|nr:hypothetical protein MICRO11B_40012 [Micrococcus luteus]
MTCGHRREDPGPATAARDDPGMGDAVGTPVQERTVPHRPDGRIAPGPRMPRRVDRGHTLAYPERAVSNSVRPGAP